MSLNILIRRAAIDELTWINERYQEVSFKRSNWEREWIAVAEVNGDRAGLGRLITIESDVAELGGIYVLKNYQGQGIASQLVRFLLQHSESFKTIFCLPFAHLLGFYQRYGFVEVTEWRSIPAEICKKAEWCNATYECGTKLLVLKR